MYLQFSVTLAKQLGVCGGMAELALCCLCRRDAEVLSVFAAIISKLREAMAAEVPRIFEAVFECTLQMITKNFEVRLLLRLSA